MKTFKVGAWVLSLLALTGVVRIGDPVPAVAEETVVYRLKWLFNTSVVGDLYAGTHGFFADHGLRVEVKEGGPERDAIREMELGRAQFGVASADQVIRALDKGASVAVIAQLFQVNPLQWMYRPDKIRIERLEDLKGQTLGVTFGGNDEAILRALLAKAGLTEKDVTLFSVRYDYTPFFQKAVNFWPVYRNSQAVFLGEKLRQAGEPFAFFSPADHGVKFVANSVVTARDILEKRPKLVTAFLSALLQGWREALAPENEAAAVAMLQRYDRDSTRETLREQLAITRELVQPGPPEAVGAIDVEAWKQTEQIMLDQRLISGPVGVERVLRPLEQ